MTDRTLEETRQFVAKELRDKVASYNGPYSSQLTSLIDALSDDEIADQIRELSFDGAFCFYLGDAHRAFIYESERDV